MQMLYVRRGSAGGVAQRLEARSIRRLYCWMEIRADDTLLTMIPPRE